MENTTDMNNQELLEYIHILESELKTEKELRKQEAEEYSALESEYEKLLDEKNRELLQAKGKIISQEITLASYKDKIGKPIIVEGEEHDLYNGEQKDFIINLLKNSIDNYAKYTRSYRLCESILSANRPIGEKEKMQETIAMVLKSYSGMTKDIISKLNNIGISVIDDTKGHYRLLLNGDDRYTLTISHSPSDNRCGINAISDINKMFF